MATMKDRATFNEIFVRTWLKAYKNKYTRSWVGGQLDLTLNQVDAKVFRLKKIGVKLPNLSSGMRPTSQSNVDKLNKLIEGADEA